MKKSLYLFLILGLTVGSCNKPDTIASEQEVSFSAAAVETGFKTSDDACNNGVANYAIIILQPLDATGAESGEQISRTLDVFYLNGRMFTTTIRLVPGNYELTSFVLMNDAGTLLDTSDDVAVYATPTEGSTFGTLIENNLPLTFEVVNFIKNEVPIQVLCFQPADYDKFGFNWFAVDVVTVNETGSFCFFGDLCLDEADLTYYDDNYNVYQEQIYGIRHDLPAIFRMKVSKWTVVSPNEGTSPNNSSQMWVDLLDITNLTPQGDETFPLYGEGAPLCVQDFESLYPGETIRYSLWVYMKETTGEYWNANYDDLNTNQSTGFRYRFVKSWYNTDTDKPVDLNGDGMIEFVIGDCSPDADLIINNISN